VKSLLRSVVNFRDVGGYSVAGGGRVRRGVVYRSAHLAAIEDGDLAKLESLRIRKVIDFRTGLDVHADGGNRLPRGAERVHLPMGDPATGDDLRKMFMKPDLGELRARLGEGQAHAMMVRSARVLVTDQREGYGGFLRALASPGGTPAVFHCSAGKDRTGWAASILLLIAGVSEDDIVEHYLESNHYRAEQNRAVLERVQQGIDPEWIRPFMEVRAEYARASIAAVREHFGGVDGYLAEGLQVAPDEVERIRALLVEGS